MGDEQSTDNEARYMTIRAALELACETLSRQHGISIMDAMFALTNVALDSLIDIAPGPMRRVCETSADVRMALSAKDGRELQKATKAHERATGRYYDAAMARYARATGGLN